MKGYKVVELVNDPRRVAIAVLEVTGPTIPHDDISKPTVYDSNFATYRTESVRVLDLVDQNNQSIDVRMGRSILCPEDDKLWYKVGEITTARHWPSYGLYFYRTFEAAKNRSYLLAMLHRWNNVVPPGTIISFYSDSGFLYGRWTCLNGTIFEDVVESTTALSE